MSILSGSINKAVWGIQCDNIHQSNQIIDNHCRYLKGHATLLGEESIRHLEIN